MVSGENFTVRAPKCRADYKQRLRQAEDGPNVITDRTFITRGFKMLLQMGPLLHLGPIITLVPFTGSISFFLSYLNFVIPARFKKQKL